MLGALASAWGMRMIVEVLLANTCAQWLVLVPPTVTPRTQLRWCVTSGS